MQKHVLILCSFIIVFVNCTSRKTIKPGLSVPKVATETVIQKIDLAGPAADRKTEISGLSWYKDYLIILPQYPDRFNEKLFAIPKSQILDFISGKNQSPITPKEIDFILPDTMKTLSGFEGFEAIVFSGNNVYIAIETEVKDGLLGYLIMGEIKEDLSQIIINPNKLVTNTTPQTITNASYEAILIAKDRIITLYEGNGKNVNPNPIAKVFDMELNPMESIPFPAIEYRITDATCLDENDCFWAINYYFPGEEAVYNPAPDEIAATYGIGATHATSKVVERLVEMKYHPDRITLIQQAPIQFQLLPGDPRNWEGLVTLDDIGFIIATDKFPETILGFVKK